MGRFEITNYARNLHFPYKADEIFLARNKTEYTDDQELADIARKFKYVDVVENVKPLLDMSKKELIARARSLGITSAANKSKAQLRKDIAQRGDQE